MKYQLCPKCLGDGHLGRHNSPAFASSNSLPQCDVCFGAKTLLVPDDSGHMIFPKNDTEIKAYRLLLKICKLEDEDPSPYGAVNDSLNRVITKLKKEYYQCVPAGPSDLKAELEKFFDWYKKSNFSSSGKTSDLIAAYLGTWTPTVTNTEKQS